MIDPIYNRIEGTKRPSLTAASGFVLLAALGLWASVLIELALPSAGIVLSNLLYYVPFVALPLALYARRHPGLSQALRLGPLPPLSALTLALLALLTVYVASAISALWSAGLDALGLTGVGAAPLPQSERELALYTLAMAALPAVCEELLFRGFVLAAWESRGTAFAIGVTSILFALLHGNLYGLPIYLLVGAVAGFVTFALDSVYAGIVYHTVYNAACLVIPYLLAGRVDAAADAAMTGSMLFSIILETATLLSLTALLLVSLRLRARNAGIEPIPRVRRPLSDRERLTLLAAILVMIASTVIVLVMAQF
ncbi:MAG: CPBP family intramembrane metalloprotease [Clostridia bacterium]|nr:CPBP family intramembrane metalloprotease [Clostridia bacterium]